MSFEGEEASKRRAQCRDGRKRNEGFHPNFEMLTVEMTLFVGSGQMWSGADVGELLVIPP